MSTPNYSNPTYLCQAAAATGLQPNILDISAFISTRLPVPLQIYIDGVGEVAIWASEAIDTSNSTPTLLYKIEVQPATGRVTSSTFIDLIQGIRFVQIEVTALNPGSTVTALVGDVPLSDGKLAKPCLVRMATNATAGM